jgi:hypothetical protein
MISFIFSNRSAFFLLYFLGAARARLRLSACRYATGSPVGSYLAAFRRFGTANRTMVRLAALRIASPALA